MHKSDIKIHLRPIPSRHSQSNQKYYNSSSSSSVTTICQTNQLGKSVFFLFFTESLTLSLFSVLFLCGLNHSIYAQNLSENKEHTSFSTYIRIHIQTVDAFAGFTQLKCFQLNRFTLRFTITKRRHTHTKLKSAVIFIINLRAIRACFRWHRRIVVINAGSAQTEPFILHVT